MWKAGDWICWYLNPELDVRRKKWKPPEAKASRGCAKLFTQHVTQAHEGCDFDFLQGTPGETPEPDIF